MLASALACFVTPAPAAPLTVLAPPATMEAQPFPFCLTAAECAALQPGLGPQPNPTLPPQASGVLAGVLAGLPGGSSGGFPGGVGVPGGVSGGVPRGVGVHLGTEEISEEVGRLLEKACQLYADNIIVKDGSQAWEENILSAVRDFKRDFPSEAAQVRKDGGQ